MIQALRVKKIDRNNHRSICPTGETSSDNGSKFKVGFSPVGENSKVDTELKVICVDEPIRTQRRCWVDIVFFIYASQAVLTGMPRPASSAQGVGWRIFKASFHFLFSQYGHHRKNASITSTSLVLSDFLLWMPLTFKGSLCLRQLSCRSNLRQPSNLCSDHRSQLYSVLDSSYKCPSISCNKKRSSTHYEHQFLRPWLKRK